MSDDPKVIDLRQATLGNLTDQLRLLTDAIIATNHRWDTMNREVTELRVDMNRQFSDVNRQFGEVRRQVMEVHSEVVTQANQIINAQHDIRRLLRGREIEEDAG